MTKHLLFKMTLISICLGGSIGARAWDPLPEGKNWNCGGAVSQTPAITVSLSTYPSRDFPTILSLGYDRMTHPFDGSWFAAKDRIHVLRTVAPIQINGNLVYRLPGSTLEIWKRGDIVGRAQVDFEFRVAEIATVDPATGKTSHLASVEYQDPTSGIQRTERLACRIQSFK